MNDADPVPQWKLDLIKRARRVEELKRQQEALRKSIKEVLDWIETQPPAIGDQSIGK